MRVDPYFSQTMAAQMDNIAGQVQGLTLELSSGVRLNSISDDPAAAANDLLLSGQSAQDAEFVQSASQQDSKLQLTDSVLGNVVTQMTSAIALATQGLNGTLSAGNVQGIGTQLIGIRDEVLGLANTSYLGQYLFSGSQVTTQPFSLDSATSPATVNYHGDGDAVSEKTPSGQSITVGFSGQSIFGTGTNVLQALNQLVADFSTGTLPASAQSDAAALSSALGNLNAARSGVDNSLNRMQAAGTYAQTEQTQLASSQDTLVQADYAQVSTQLKSAETQQSALYDVIASISQNNLFDVLH